MQNFVVCGPFDVRFDGGAEKHITAQHGREFWQGPAEECVAGSGIYIFGVKTPRNYVPIYVGKATRSFKQEVFAPHKLNHYNAALFERRKGKPVIFLLVRHRRRGKASAGVVGEVERYVIQIAKEANPGLLNTHHAGAGKWAIVGVGTKKQGKPTGAISAFRQMLKL